VSAASSPGERVRKVSLGGAVLAAILASSCCIGPLLVAALGLGGAGAFAMLAAYRPYILGMTTLLLAIGLYLAYRRKPRAATPDACGCEKPKASRAGRIGLWMAVVLTATFAAAPSLLAYATQHRAPPPVGGQHLEQTVLQVRGIDCEACASPLRHALTKVGGFHDLQLDVPKQTITIVYEPAPGRIAAYVAAINDLGYEASLPNDPAGRTK
jgi:mercuric ion transport protein